MQEKEKEEKTKTKDCPDDGKSKQKGNKSSQGKKKDERKRMSEDEKKKKFGDKYDPNYKFDSRKQNSSKKTKSKTDKKEDNSGKEEEKIPKHNDPLWHVLSEQIAKDFGSIPYNWIPGTDKQLKVVVKQANSTSLTDQPIRTKMSAIMTLGYIPSIGTSVDKVSGVNMAATQLYTAVRRANSGARNYEAADLMMYILALVDIYSEFAELRRIIGCAEMYVLDNHNLPDALISAMGVSPDSVRSNIANVRGRLNLLAKKINAFAVPKTYTIIKRRDFVASNVFADSSSIRGQFYVYVKKGYYTWSGTASEQGSSLVFTRRNFMTEGFQTMQSRISQLESQINALFLDDDINTMSGDILKAFGESNLFALAQIEEGYSLAPLYDEDALAQIENSIPYGNYTGSTEFEASALSITQENQLIQFNPGFTLGSAQYGIPQSVILNSHKDNPDYLNSVEWTRCTCTAEITSTSTAVIVNFHSGCEIIETYAIYGYMKSGEKPVVTDGSGQIQVPLYTFNTTININDFGLAKTVALLQQFDWHPIYYQQMRYTATTAGTAVLIPVGDLKVPTMVDMDVITSLHDVANTAVVWDEGFYKALKIMQ